MPDSLVSPFYTSLLDAVYIDVTSVPGANFFEQLTNAIPLAAQQGRYLFVPAGTHTVSVADIGTNSKQWGVEDGIEQIRIVGVPGLTIIQGPGNNRDGTGESFLNWDSCSIFINGVTFIDWPRVVTHRVNGQDEDNFDDFITGELLVEDCKFYDCDNPIAVSHGPTFSSTPVAPDTLAAQRIRCGKIQIGRIRVRDNTFERITGRPVRFVAAAFRAGVWIENNSFYELASTYEGSTAIAVGARSDFAFETAAGIFISGNWGENLMGAARFDTQLVQVTGVYEAVITNNRGKNIWNRERVEDCEGIYTKAVRTLISSNILQDTGGAESMIRLKGNADDTEDKQLGNRVDVNDNILRSSLGSYYVSETANLTLTSVEVNEVAVDLSSPQDSSTSPDYDNGVFDGTNGAYATWVVTGTGGPILRQGNTRCCIQYDNTGWTFSRVVNLTLDGVFIRSIILDYRTTKVEFDTDIPSVLTTFRLELDTSTMATKIRGIYSTNNDTRAQRNRVEGTTDGVRVLGANTVVRGNEIDGLVYQNASPIGIYVGGDAVGTGFSELRNLRVIDNQIRNHDLNTSRSPNAPVGYNSTAIYVNPEENTRQVLVTGNYIDRVENPNINLGRRRSGVIIDTKDQYNFYDMYIEGNHMYDVGCAIFVDGDDDYWAAGQGAFRNNTVRLSSTGTTLRSYNPGGSGALPDLSGDTTNTWL